MSFAGVIKGLLLSNLNGVQLTVLRSIFRRWKLVANYRYDYLRFLKYSTVARHPETKGQLSASLIFDYHRIEKGMSLPNSRPGFGETTIGKILDDLERYEEIFGVDELSKTVEAVLRAYQNFQKQLSVRNAKLDAFLKERPFSPAKGGVIDLSLFDLFPVDRDVACRFLRSRHSVRNFTGECVDRDLMTRAVQLAQCAPSVCNRQSGRVYACNEPLTVARVLAHQNGNRGFGDTLGAVFIVAVEVESFMNVAERNQPYVDGGIFAMALLQGLHALQLGACMLNWSAEREADIALRREFNIPDNQVIITLIGAGYPVEKLKVAASPRFSTEEISTWIN